MKIVFAGTPEFSLASIEAIYDEGHELVGVITQPDRRRGRGKQVVPSPIKEWALQKGLPIYQPEKIGSDDFTSDLKGLAPDLMVTAAYGQILPKRTLNIPKLGCINVHASLLPKYRGASPIQQAIMDGEIKTGITIMYMDAGMDTGDIILQQELDIDPNEDCESLHDRLSVLGGRALRDALKLFEGGKPEGQPQDHEKATYCKKIEKSMGRIHWSMKGEDIRNLVRALTPWPGTYTHLEGERLKIWEVNPLHGGVKDNISPGTIIHSDDENGLVVKASDGALRLRRVQVPGKRAMEDREFLRGNTIKPGTVLD